MSSSRDPPPVLVVCCGRRHQVAVDNMVECPSCEELHRVQYSGRQKPHYDIGKTEIVSREVLEQTGTNEFGPTYRCPRCDYPSISEYCDCPECGWAGMCQEGWE